jgi:hypothetical protein
VEELSRKEARPLLRKSDTRNNGDNHAASLRDTEEVPLASRQTAEVLPAVASGGSGRGE